MPAELAKIKALPTPRWTAIVVLGLVVVGFVLLVLLAGSKDSDYSDTAQTVGLVTLIASMVLGVWMVGLEYGQNTLRRTLTADPRRPRLLGAKLGAALVTSGALTLAAYVLATILFGIAAAINGASLSVPDVFNSLLAALLGNAVIVAVGVGVALIVRSMAGGMTVMLSVFFIIDTILLAIPTVGDWSIKIAVFEIQDSINGAGDSVSIGHDALVLALWIAVSFGAGFLRFTRSDVV
jgi:ABC-2 type transport system permease protein